MKLVIDIPKELFDKMVDVSKLPELELAGDFTKAFVISVVTGTPLPEHHGKLIDADAFERKCMFDSNIEDMQDVIYALRDYKPIIPATEEGDGE